MAHLGETIDPYLPSLNTIDIVVHSGNGYRKKLVLNMDLMNDEQTFSIYRDGELIDTYKDYVGAVLRYNRVTATSRELSLR
jgi:hypothetical protein